MGIIGMGRIPKSKFSLIYLAFIKSSYVNEKVKIKIPK